jgi:threonylcarbamoyladenosine tRNA methylthiotransferase MtaB
MRRRYDTHLLRDVTAEIRRHLPDAGLGTDVIAGFPGETDAEFDRTFDLLAALPFTYFHVFPYSRRSGTTAAKLPGHLPKTEVAARARRLRKQGERKRAEFGSRFVGRVLMMLAEGEGADGYARNYVRVRITDGPTRAMQEVAVRIAACNGSVAIGSLARG